jgi:hypothetical protein
MIRLADDPGEESIDEWGGSWRKETVIVKDICHQEKKRRMPPVWMPLDYHIGQDSTLPYNTRAPN